MDVLTDSEIDAVVSKSRIAAKYNQEIDSHSAYEILTEKLKIAAERTAEEDEKKPARKTAKKEESIFDNPTVKQVGRTAASIITRSLLGALGIGGTRKKKSSWF